MRPASSGYNSIPLQVRRTGRRDVVGLYDHTEDTMKRTVLLGTLLAALLAPMAMAHAHDGIAVSVNTPDFGIRIGGPFYGPPPVYAPIPVYAPAPVYVPPPRVIYPAPVVVAPRVIVPGPVVYGPGAVVRVAPYGYGGHWRYRHEERREYRHGRHDRHDHHDRYDRSDRGQYRAGYGF